MKKLTILRVLILAVFNIFLFTMAHLPKWARKIEFVQKGEKLVWPIFWLRHYLRGSGKALQVPTQIVKEAEQVFLTAIKESNDSYCQGSILGGYASLKYRPYCVYHSTLYEGAGFHGRPTLFYLLGGFTFRLYPGDIWTRWDGERVESLLVSGKDRYDWHPDEHGRFFSSPIGTGKFAAIILRVAGALFGRKYFFEKGSSFSVTGEQGISNELWYDLGKVGAREFNSFFRNIEIADYGLADGDFEELFDPDLIREREYEEEREQWEQYEYQEEDYEYED